MTVRPLSRPMVVGPTSLPDLPAAVPALAALGVALVVAVLVATTPIGSGDYGQWLMVSRSFSGESTPAYRALSDVPPLVPIVIAWLAGWLGDPVTALHAVGFMIVLGLGMAFFAGGMAVDGRTTTGLVAIVLGLLVTDRFLELMAFGGLLQAAAIVFMLVSVAAFTHMLRSAISQRRWWALGCVALLGTCVTHVPTATIALPVCAVAAVATVIPGPRAALLGRIRRAVPLLLGLITVGAYWAIVVVPETGAYVANPASLAYRGPERVFQALAEFPPTLVIVAIGLVTLGRWAAVLLGSRFSTGAGDPRTVLLAWFGASWAAFSFSALTQAATDYPRFVPLLLAPLVVAAAVGIGATAATVGRISTRVATAERGLMAIGLAVVLIAPFSIANFQSEASGYRLPDDRSLAAAARWADSRLVPGAAVLAPVREGKWLEGLTGRAALFSSEVRYAFRPVEWERSLAASTLIRGNLGLVNESFALIMTDGVATPDGQQPRSILLAANHGGEYVDLLRLVPSGSLVHDADGGVLASLPALIAAGSSHAVGPNSIGATTRWVATRRGGQIAYVQTVSVERGTDSFDLDVRATSTFGPGGLQIEFRPPSGVALVDVDAGAGYAALTFSRMGRTQPRLRLEAPNAQIVHTATGGLLIETPAAHLSLRVTALTAGSASSSLRLLDPAALVDAYGIGAAILRRDPSYEARRARLELLGFHVARAEGPYIVMVRRGAAIPETP